MMLLVVRAGQLGVMFSMYASFMCFAAAVGRHAPLPTQIVALANNVDGVHAGFVSFMRKRVVNGYLKSLIRSCAVSRERYSTAARFRLTRASRTAVG